MSRSDKQRQSIVRGNGVTDHSHQQLLFGRNGAVFS
jgi:hypothetical protein